MQPSFDVIVVGAGHNGLVCAGYLARHGHKVLVVERRGIVGGAVCTEEMFGGYKIDVGSSAHIMIHTTPIVDDLALAQHGLVYLDADPFAFYPCADGKHIAFHRDVEQTCASIARVSPRDADAYRAFIAFWTPINEAVFDVFLAPPTPGRLGWRMLTGQVGRTGAGVTETLRRIFTSYGQVITEAFESNAMRSAMMWLAAQSGPPPMQTGTGDFAGWHAMLHRTGMKRPVGGSGMLTQALASYVRAQGGEIWTDAPVRRITLDRGRATGIETTDGRVVTARAVVSNAHIWTTMLHLVGEANLDPALVRRLKALRVGNGFGMVVRCATTELPRYEVDDLSVAHTGLQLLCDSPEQLVTAYGDFVGGAPSRDPCVLAMTFSAIDPTLAPPGRHTVNAWAQYFPYALASGAKWADIREREADKILGVLARHAPNMKHAILDRFIQTPADIETLLGMPHGNVMHLEMELDQMFLWRPLPELADYTTPIAGLFLTGASTHPGGGVWGASGYNTAGVVTRALGRPRR